MRVEVIVQGVVAVFRIEADFDVVAFPSVASQYVPHFVAEVSLHFQDQSADSLPAVVGLIGNKLLGEGIHAATCLAGTNRTEDCDAGEESALGDLQPRGFPRGCWPTGVVDLSDHYIKVAPHTRVWVTWQASGLVWPVNFQNENIEAGEQDRIADEGRCV